MNCKLQSNKFVLVMLNWHCSWESAPLHWECNSPKKPQTETHNTFALGQERPKGFPQSFLDFSKICPLRAQSGSWCLRGITDARGAAWSSTSHHTRGVNTLGLRVPARKGLTLVPNSQKSIQILQMATYWQSRDSARYLELFKPFLTKPRFPLQYNQICTSVSSTDL